jgi:hypothetical protein
MENDPPSTPDQHAAIKLAALERVRYFRWLADGLLKTDDISMRRAAADAIRELTDFPRRLDG